jgi:hypothetical protein
MTNENQTRLEKSTYIKPQVTEVRLVAGEAVLGSCKDGLAGYSACDAIEESCGNSDQHS